MRDDFDGPSLNPHFQTNPLFPALRSSPTAFSGASRKKQIPSSQSGSRSQEIIAARLDSLSTYGILKDKGTGYLNGLMRALSESGLIQTVTGEFPLITLTAMGDKVMRGEIAYQLVWPDPEAGKKETALKDHGLDSQLYSMLRDHRARIAKREDVPPYVIFNNKTLEAMARYQPINTEEALHIPGIGEAKIQRYAEPFLEMIRVWKKSRR